VTNGLVQKHCGLTLKDERITVPLDDVTSVSVSKAPYLWNYLFWGISFVIIGVLLAIKTTTFQNPGIIIIAFGALLLIVFTFYACYPRTYIYVNTKLTAPAFCTWAPLVLAFNYIYTGEDSAGAEVKIGSEEDTAGVILAPKNDECELGRWTVEKKNNVQSLIVTNKRVAFRTYVKFCCCTSVEYLESIRPSEIQGLKLMTSPYVIERLYFGLFLIIVGIVLITQDPASSGGDGDDTGSDPDPAGSRRLGGDDDSSSGSILNIVAYIMFAFGFISILATFCGKLDRVIVHLKSTTPIIGFFLNRAVEMQVPIGQGQAAYDLIRSEVVKYQDDYAAI
jgi:hypothetical protein